MVLTGCVVDLRVNRHVHIPKETAVGSGTCNEVTIAPSHTCLRYGFASDRHLGLHMWHVNLIRGAASITTRIKACHISISVLTSIQCAPHFLSHNYNNRHRLSSAGAVSSTAFNASFSSAVRSLSALRILTKPMKIVRAAAPHASSNQKAFL